MAQQYNYELSDGKGDIVETETRPYSNAEILANRASEYASIQDQLDMIYWDKANGTTVWQDHIAAVKSRYPKAN